MAKFCTACGTANSDTSTICRKCNRPLPASTVSSRPIQLAPSQNIPPRYAQQNPVHTPPPVYTSPTIPTKSVSSSKRKYMPLIAVILVVVVLAGVGYKVWKSTGVNRLVGNWEGVAVGEEYEVAGGTLGFAKDQMKFQEPDGDYYVGKIQDITDVKIITSGGRFNGETYDETIEIWYRLDKDIMYWYFSGENYQNDNADITWEKVD